MLCKEYSVILDFWISLLRSCFQVTTVDRFQGQQNDYILLSLVKTRAVGHIRWETDLMQDTGPVHKGSNHVPKAVSDHDPLPAILSQPVATAVPITNRICALRGHILFLLRWLTLWPMHGFSAHFQNAHARIMFRKSLHSQVLRIRLSRQITIQNALFLAFQKPDLKELCIHKGKIRLSNQERVRITIRNSFQNMICSFVNRPTVPSRLCGR